MIRLPALAVLLAVATPAAAADLFVGAYKHDVNLFTKTIHEGGADIELGYRGNRIAGLGPIGGPAPYAFVSLNSAKKTNFIAAGLSWKFGGPIYVRPGIGLAVQDGPRRRYLGTTRIDLGSPVLFEPELAIGWQLLPRIALEASYTHLSHAQLFGKQNPGLDMLGARLVFHLP